MAAALLPPSLVFDAATVLVMPFYFAIIAAPGRAWAQRLLGAGPVFAACAVLYGLLLAAWNPVPRLVAVARGAAATVQAAAATGGGTPLLEAWRGALPSMPAFAALFTSPEITAVAWVHLLLLDLLQARWVYQDGRRHNLPVWHSAILCFMVGPLGLLCHLATKTALLGWRRRGQPRGEQEQYVVYRF